MEDPVIEHNDTLNAPVGTRIKNRYRLIELKNLSMILALIGVLTVLFIGSLFIGQYMMNPITVVLILVSWTLEFIGNAILSLTGVKLTFFWCIHQTWPSFMDQLVSLRIPRAVAVVLVGSGLSISGAVFQGTFRNPLVSESILGVSAGASVGAALGILMGESNYMVELLAFSFGLLAVGMTYGISRTQKNNPTLVMVLAGVIVGNLFTAVTSMMKFVADPDSKLPAITYWLMGSFVWASAKDVWMVAPVILIGIAILLLIRWRINILSLGDEEAKALGVDTKQLRIIIILCATLITAAAVCISGLVGYVGLVIPQISRMVVGPNYKAMLPITVLIGACYMLIVDMICRILGELPIGVVTALVGAPIFIYLLKNTMRSWS
jgi:iron complex transport system permease protein